MAGHHEHAGDASLSTWVGAQFRWCTAADQRILQRPQLHLCCQDTDLAANERRGHSAVAHHEAVVWCRGGQITSQLAATGLWANAVSRSFAMAIVFDHDASERGIASVGVAGAVTAAHDRWVRLALALGRLVDADSFRTALSYRNATIRTCRAFLLALCATASTAATTALALDADLQLVSMTR